MSKKRKSDPVEIERLSGGATRRYQCNNPDCLIEYEVTYEPKAKEGLSVPGATPMACPFCGSGHFEEC